MILFISYVIISVMHVAIKYSFLLVFYGKLRNKIIQFLQKYKFPWKHKVIHLFQTWLDWKKNKKKPKLLASGCRSYWTPGCKLCPRGKMSQLCPPSTWIHVNSDRQTADLCNVKEWLHTGWKFCYRWHLAVAGCFVQHCVRLLCKA